MIVSTIWLICFTVMGLFLLGAGLSNLKSSRVQSSMRNKLRYEAMSRQITRHWLAEGDNAQITREIKELDKLHKQLSKTKSQMLNLPRAAHGITLNWLAQQRALLKAEDFFPEFSDKSRDDSTTNMT
ncbi:MAG: hypothetical protein EOL87_06925 [Spartobacteria bacterium]|nr:hypothetical protein [Spartobacteria bacterium]